MHVMNLPCMNHKIKEIIDYRGNTLVICQNDKTKGVVYT